MIWVWWCDNEIFVTSYSSVVVVDVVVEYLVWVCDDYLIVVVVCEYEIELLFVFFDEMKMLGEDVMS